MPDTEGAQQAADDPGHAAASDPSRQTSGQPFDGNGLVADVVAAWDATRALADSTRSFALALVGLARSEWRLARASWPLVVAISIVLVGLSLSLWASLISLIGWALYVATGSVGWALAALVAIHLVLLVLARWLLRRTARNLTLPATRVELNGLLARARNKQSRKESQDHDQDS